MKQPAGSERTLVLMGAIALVLFGYVFGLLLPLNRQAGDLTRDRIAFEGQLERADNMYTSAQRAEEEIVKLKEQTAAMMFPQSDVGVEMVRRLERLARETQLTITSIRPEDSEAIDGAIRYPATFKVEADFADLIDLMYKLEQPDTRLWLEGVEIQAPRRDEDKLQATFYVAAYGSAPDAAGKEAADAAA